MTADTMTGDRERCLDAGMNGYVSKPLNIKEIPGIIRKYVSDEKEIVKPYLQEEVIDRTSAIKMVDGDLELYEHICKLFREQFPCTIEVIKEAIDCNDTARVGYKAHSLVSNAGSVGAFLISKAAAELECAARNKNTAIFGELYEKLDYETKRVLKELQ
jgi:two-component system sensor histidine kinase/response regulator